MKKIDQAQYDADVAALKVLKELYAESLGNPPGLNLDDAVYRAVSQYGVANMTGVPLERVSVATQLKAMRLMWDALNG